MQTPTVGRSVHYHRDTADKSIHVEAAIITAIDENTGAISLAIFSTMEGDAPVWSKKNVPCSETPAPGCWSWPPRV